MPVKEEKLRGGNLFSSLVSQRSVHKLSGGKSMPHVLETKMCVRDSGHRGGGVLLGFWNCSLLKTRKYGTKEAASKAQAIAATHALHAFSIPKGKEWGGGPLERREMARLVKSALVQQ